MSTTLRNSLFEQATAALRRKGNPFRQQFARNSDDNFCSLYDVSSLFSAERLVLRELVESYRGDAARQTAVLPIIGARGAGKTHLLHWLKHGPGVPPQLFVTPGTFRIDAGGQDSSFIEYMLYQLINVLMSADEQRGVRPLVYVGEQLCRRVLADAVGNREPQDRLELMPVSSLRRWALKFGLGMSGAQATFDAFLVGLREGQLPCRALANQANLDPEKLTAITLDLLQKREARDLKGEFRKRIISGFVRATLLDDEAELADFLTDGFADVAFLVRPTRTQLTLSLMQALTELIVGSGIPIAIAFDQLEELLYGQTDDAIRRASDAFFGGVVQVMSQVPGLCVLLFVEEGLWNRIVPPLPPHILDRIHEPIHLSEHGSIRNVRLSTPSVEQLTEVVRCRVNRTLGDFADLKQLPADFPFGHEFLSKLSRRETVLRLMLQGCCNRLDELFDAQPNETADSSFEANNSTPTSAAGNAAAASLSETATTDENEPPLELPDRWHQEVRAAERKLKPVGCLSAATAELLGGLARWLQLCKSLGVEQGQWRMAEVVDQIQIGDHPTYGALTVVEWAGPDERKLRVGIGLWLGRGVGKPRDLETKLAVFAAQPAVVDHLILLRPADDARLSGKTKAALDQAKAAGQSVRVEPVQLDVFARLYAFPRWMQQVADTYSEKIPDQVYLFLAEQTEEVIHKLALPGETEPARDAA